MKTTIGRIIRSVTEMRIKRSYYRGLLYAVTTLLLLWLVSVAQRSKKPLSRKGDSQNILIPGKNWRELLKLEMAEKNALLVPPNFKQKWSADKYIKRRVLTPEQKQVFDFKKAKIREAQAVEQKRNDLQGRQDDLQKMLIEERQAGGVQENPDVQGRQAVLVPSPVDYENAKSTEFYQDFYGFPQGEKKAKPSGGYSAQRDIDYFIPGVKTDYKQIPMIPDGQQDYNQFPLIPGFQTDYRQIPGIPGVQTDYRQIPGIPGVQSDHRLVPMSPGFSPDDYRQIPDLYNVGQPVDYLQFPDYYNQYNQPEEKVESNYIEEGNKEEKESLRTPVVEEFEEVMTEEEMKNKSGLPFRVVCLVITQPKNHKTKARAVLETWGRKCTHLHFISSRPKVWENGVEWGGENPEAEKIWLELAGSSKQSNDESEQELGLDLPVIYSPAKETYENLWAKTKFGFRYAYDNYLNEADWFLKADDDTYIVMENLENFLKDKRVGDMTYYGRHFKYGTIKQGYMSGGAGYVMSKDVLKVLVEDGFRNSTICRETEAGIEDVEMGVCMEKLNILPGRTRNRNTGEELFHLYRLEKMVNMPSNDWLYTYGWEAPNKGSACCGSEVISFHYATPEDMYAMEFLLYRLRVSPLSYEIESNNSSIILKNHLNNAVS